MHGTARGAMYSTVIHFSLIQRDVAGSQIQGKGKTLIHKRTQQLR